MSSPESVPEGVWLVYGSTGWIGGMLCDMLDNAGIRYVRATSRLDAREDCAREIDLHAPIAVLNCAGLTGRPTVDWCEDHKLETMRVNVVGTMSLIDLCCERGIHCTNFATGCIYKYDAAHPIGGPGFSEEEEPNFTGSFYSYTKCLTEKMCKFYDNLLVLRLRMPISDDLHPKNLITKIAKYNKVIDIPNSVTVLSDLLPVAITMTQRGIKGVFNFTNPGAISHVEILDLYKKYIDPTFWYDTFTEEEQSHILKAPRSNNTLDVSKLLAVVPDCDIPDIKTSVTRVFERMRASLVSAGTFPPPNPKGPRQ